MSTTLGEEFVVNLFRLPMHLHTQLARQLRLASCSTEHDTTIRRLPDLIAKTQCSLLGACLHMHKIMPYFIEIRWAKNQQNSHRERLYAENRRVPQDGRMLTW